ncbi:MAG: RHS repeat-associated core domain-containing protein [Pirellulaceae bacterium]|nr:RHS repeat-associated core domain-containing protein [Pirellulaceae bacterium]
MLSAGDQFAGYAYTYDRLGRMTISDAAIAGLAPTVTLTNAYDAAGRRTQVAATVGGNADFVTNYAYDQLGRTTSIRQYASPTSVLPVADKRVDFTYDLASQLATLTRYADLSGNQLVAATDYLFDQAGRLTGMTHGRQLPLPPGEGGGEGVFADYDWAFDEANRMTRFESLIDGVVDYTNDDTGQLTAAEYTAGTGLPTAPPDEQYVYDENGNRVNNGYTVGPNNQLLSDGTHTYTYDEEGNRTSRTHIATGEVTEYTWEHRNRLTRVSTRATANGPLTTDIHYAYDFGQRWIRKTLDTNADGTIEESRVFVHDARQIVLDFEKIGMGDGESTDLTHRYLWGSRVDQILADEIVNTGTAGDMAWLLTDYVHSVRDVVEYDPTTDTTSVIKHIAYGAFGNVTSDSGPGIDSLFLFTARPYDPDTGLQNNLNRWYDLSTGRWMTEDPIGFEARDANLLRYVGNRPTKYVDPLGLLKFAGVNNSPYVYVTGETFEGYGGVYWGVNIDLSSSEVAAVKRAGAAYIVESNRLTVTAKCCSECSCDERLDVDGSSELQYLYPISIDERGNLQVTKFDGQGTKGTDYFPIYKMVVGWVLLPNMKTCGHVRVTSVFKLMPGNAPQIGDEYDFHAPNKAFDGFWADDPRTGKQELIGATTPWKNFPSLRGERLDELWAVADSWVLVGGNPISRVTLRLDAKWNCKGEVLSKKAWFTDDMTGATGNVVGNEGRATR